MSLPIEDIVRARLAEGDSAGEIGPHLEGAVLDRVLPILGGNLPGRETIEGALALVDWSKVAQSAIWEIEGSNPWRT